MFKTIVRATDDSELADGALDLVRELALQDGSRIVAVHASELLYSRLGGSPALPDGPSLEQKIGQQVETLRSDGLDASFEILSGSKDVATHGHGGLTAALMGSVARGLCHTARRPLLVVPPPTQAGDR